MLPQPYHEDIPAEEPRFDFDVVAESLAAFLLRESKGAKIVGLHGPWGSGKTTLMNAVRRKVGDRLSRDSAVFVDFNAWKFQDRQTLWRALILRVLGELRNFQGDVKEIEEMERALYQAFEVEEHGPLRLNWRALITEVVSIVLSVLKLDFVGKALKKAPSWLKLVLLGENATENREQAETLISSERVESLVGVLERSVITRHVQHVRSLEQFLERFRRLISRLRGDGKRIFVFVDDLDRCLPEAALEVFEAVKLFLDAEGCAYVVALDREVIRNGLAVRYSAPGEAARGQSLIDADEYIEKTISLSFDLPRLSDGDILELIDDFSLGMQLDKTSQKLVFAGLSYNARRVKRFFNTLSLQLKIVESLENATGEKSVVRRDDLPDFAVFLKLFLISYRYSGVFSAFLEDSGLVGRLQKIANAYYADLEKDQLEARNTRNTKLKSESASIRRLEFEEEFWVLMSLAPNLIDKPEQVKSLLSWFRSR